MVKRFVFFLFILLSFVLMGCVSSDLYKANYPGDREMQERMIRDYGNDIFPK